MNPAESTLLPRVCAVSYLNTVPLVWGMLHGRQTRCFDLQFAVPSECADRLESGRADIGLVPCAELERLHLEPALDVGIACEGAVRSILLVSRTAPADIRTLAGDISSRTSVQLARIVLSQRYGTEPAIVSLRPDLPSMLEQADAALIIGDPALHLDPATIPFHAMDLGHEWLQLTGLPMVFAVWAGRRAIGTESRAAFIDSYRYGRQHFDDVIAHAVAEHGVSAELAREYLTRHIRFELGTRERAGLEKFQQLARQMTAPQEARV